MVMMQAGCNKVSVKLPLSLQVTGGAEPESYRDMVLTALMMDISSMSALDSTHYLEVLNLIVID